MPSTSYDIVDGQVVVPAAAGQRLGIRPVVTLTADGGEKATVNAGEPVVLNGTIAVPPGAGYVVATEWDFEGDGTTTAPKRLRASKRTFASR